MSHEATPERLHRGGEVRRVASSYILSKIAASDSEWAAWLTKDKSKEYLKDLNKALTKRAKAKAAAEPSLHGRAKRDTPESKPPPSQRPQPRPELPGGNLGAARDDEPKVSGPPHQESCAQLASGSCDDAVATKETVIAPSEEASDVREAQQPKTDEVAPESSPSG